MTWWKNIISDSFLRLVFGIALGTITICNCFVLNQELKRIGSAKPFMKEEIIGYQFAGLQEFTKNIEVMGYYIDSDIDAPGNSKKFSQAQYVLAPTILDLNNLDHEYILFVCQNEKLAWLKMKELKAIPLRRNPFGMILAQRQ